MTTAFSLPTTAGNGPGTAVDISALGAEKTFILKGNGSAREPYVIIEISNDELGVNWSTLVMFNQPGTKTLSVAARWMRATVTNYRGGGAPVIDIGGNETGTAITGLAVPAGNGVGAGVDVSGMPGYKTIQLTGAYRGTVIVEASNDGGANYSLAAAFPAGGTGIQSMVLLAEFVRVRRTGLQQGAINPGSPTLSLAAASTGEDSGGDIDPTPPFEIETITIYARTSGNDVTGTGELANPYATMTKAVTQVPPIIGPGKRYVVDITGITETLPLEYELPCWKAPEIFGESTTDPFPHIWAVAIEAQPQLMAAISAADATITQPADLDTGGFPASGVTTINASGVPAGYSFDPITGLLTLNLAVARASWNANALKGKFLTDVDSTIQPTVIVASTTTSLSFANSVAPLGTLQVMEPSAWLKTQCAPNAAAHRGGLNAYNIDSIAFNGLKITNLLGNQFGLSCAGNGYVSAQLCELQDANFSSFNLLAARVYANWIYGARARFQGPVTVQRSLLETIPTVNVFSFAQLNFRHVVVSGCGAISAARSLFPGGSGFQTVPADLLFVEQSTFKNGTSHALLFNGGRGRFFAVDFAGNNGDAIRMAGGPAFAEVLACGSSVAQILAGSFGVNNTDGTYVKVDAATSATQPGAGRGLRGAGGDMKVGGGATRTWSNFDTGADNRPVRNEFDLTPGTFAIAGIGDTVDADTPAVGTARLTDAAAAFTAAMVGRLITIAGGAGGNNGTFLITHFISATQIAYGNTAAVTETVGLTWSVSMATTASTGTGSRLYQ